MRTIIAFDISNNRARYRVVKVLHEHTQRVQKSVFEGSELTKAQYLRLRRRLEGLVDAETDSLRYYRLCAACAARIEHHGVGPGQIVLPGSFEIIG